MGHGDRPRAGVPDVAARGCGRSAVGRASRLGAGGRPACRFAGDDRVWVAARRRLCGVERLGTGDGREASHRAAARRGDHDPDRRWAVRLVPQSALRRTARRLGGCWASAASVWTLVALPLEWALLRWGAVLPEERYLTAKFGASYADYTSRVRRSALSARPTPPCGPSPVPMPTYPRMMPSSPPAQRGFDTYGALGDVVAGKALRRAGFGDAGRRS